MTTYALDESKMFMDIADGIAIVINSETGIYYGLNAFGTSVLEALTKGIDSDEVLEKIKTIVGVPLNFEKAFGEFVSKLIEEGLLIVGSASQDNFVIDEKIALEDQFKMEIKSYADAQEMLLADPIHEVKETTGWTPEKNPLGIQKKRQKSVKRK